MSRKNDCNKTVLLAREYPKAFVWSPGFPKAYPDNVNCVTTIIAPTGFKIIIDFEELFIENEPSCEYDYLDIWEPPQGFYKNLQNHSKSDTLKTETLNKHINFEILKNNNVNQILNSFPNSLEKYGSIIIKTPEFPKGYTLFSDAKPNEEKFLKRICGDWSHKLKLLRFYSRNSIVFLRFKSDYSNHFPGFKAKISMENRNNECSDERLVFHNGTCYLFGSYPEVSWWTAKEICKGIGAELSSVSTADELEFLTTNIRNQIDYNPQIIYWLGGIQSENGNLLWANKEKPLLETWEQDRQLIYNESNVQSCLGLHWKIDTDDKLNSGLYWRFENCTKTGGYICKQIINQKFYEFKIRNETISGTEGRLTSPGYPNIYPPNTDYWIHLLAPDKHRIIIQFQKIDLEVQSECLYDFITLQNLDNPSKLLLEPGFNLVPIAMLTSEVEIEDTSYYNRLHYLKRMKRSNYIYSKLYYTDNKKHTQREKEGKRRFHGEKTKRIKRTLKTTITENTIVNQQFFDYNDANYNAQTFLPYVRWCGLHNTNMSKFDFVSLSNEVTINFHSDYSNAGAGFAAIWKAIDLSACPTQILTSKEGAIQSPNYPYFLINNLDCTFIIQATHQKRIWLEFQDYNLLAEAIIYIDIGTGWFEPFQDIHHINEGTFISRNDLIKINIYTGQKPRGRGFKLLYKIGNTFKERILKLSNNTNGFLYHLNYPNSFSLQTSFTHHIIAPLGYVILLEIYGLSINENECFNQNYLEITDNYADNNGTKWFFCNYSLLHDNEKQIAPVHITSYLNSIYITQSLYFSTNFILNISLQLQQDINFKIKLATGDNFVESCNPNPCFFKGKCTSKRRKHICQCDGHFTGKFCALNVCELEPCIFGQCELTETSFQCNCQLGYTGSKCEQKQKPCTDNPCEGRGECLEKNEGFFCRCHAWWEGKRCERRMLRIPYKPLSERMLQEPFWLGLITVFVVLVFIGLVWCAKRHFPEKIEKLLAEEATRNRPISSLTGHHHHTSLREQLQFTSGTSNSSSVNAQGTSRSIFNKLGIRKPSILSLNSHNPSGGSAPRTISLDDLLRPNPRPKTDEKSGSRGSQKKRNNSTPIKKSVGEKRQILHYLVSSTNRSSIPVCPNDVSILLSDKEIPASGESNYEFTKETTFTRESNVENLSKPLCDDKFEKKVTFAKLLNKVSAEMNLGYESNKDDICKNSNTLKITSETSEYSGIKSHCSKNIKSTKETSLFKKNGLPSRSSETGTINKVIRASIVSHNTEILKTDITKTLNTDSRLSVLRNLNSPSERYVKSDLSSASYCISESLIPIICNQQTEIQGVVESLCPLPIPVSFSIKPTDSPINSGQNKIDIPVFDAVRDSKTSSNTNFSQPPAVLLEIPTCSISKCLSPIRELPTPIPSPALSPIMPRMSRSQNIITRSYENLSSDQFRNNNSQQFKLSSRNIELSEVLNGNRVKNDGKAETSANEPPEITSKVHKLIRPKNLVIPHLIVEHPSPTTKTLPIVIFPDSCTPGQSDKREINFIFSEKKSRKR